MDELDQQFVLAQPGNSPVGAFTGTEPTTIMPALDQLASQGGAWVLVAVLLGVIGYLFRHIIRENAAQREEDRKTIDRLATIIANNTAGFQILSEIVRGRKDRPE